VEISPLEGAADLGNDLVRTAEEIGEEKRRTIQPAATSWF